MTNNLFRKIISKFSKKKQEISTHLPEDNRIFELSDRTKINGDGITLYQTRCKESKTLGCWVETIENLNERLTHREYHDISNDSEISGEVVIDAHCKIIGSKISGKGTFISCTISQSDLSGEFRSLPDTFSNSKLFDVSIKNSIIKIQSFNSSNNIKIEHSNISVDNLYLKRTTMQESILKGTDIFVYYSNLTKTNVINSIIKCCQVFSSNIISSEISNLNSNVSSQIINSTINNSILECNSQTSSVIDNFIVKNSKLLGYWNLYEPKYEPMCEIINLKLIYGKVVK